MTLSPAALDLLAWLRDNEHHASSCIPLNAEPGKHTHILLERHGPSFAATKDVYTDAYPFIQVADWHMDKRMFKPNADGLAALVRAGMWKCRFLAAGRAV